MDPRTTHGRKRPPGEAVSGCTEPVTSDGVRSSTAPVPIVSAPDAFFASGPSQSPTPEPHGSTMRWVCITDLHGRRDALANILEHAGRCDAVLLGGDITHFGSPIDVRRIVEQAQAASPHVWAVAGNCDSATIQAELDRLGVLLHGRGIVHRETGLQGLSGIPLWKAGMYHFPEEELAAALEAGHRAIPAVTHRVVLAHCPPRGTRADRAFWFLHVGSTAIREFLERTHPHLILCGHIHEARGIELWGTSTIVNCGLGARGQYAVIEIGREICVGLHKAPAKGAKPC